jgi:hypothetical protein
VFELKCGRRPSKLVNPTVSGIHPGDLGQYEIAEFYVGFLAKHLPAASTA